MKQGNSSINDAVNKDINDLSPENSFCRSGSKTSTSNQINIDIPSHGKSQVLLCLKDPVFVVGDTIINGIDETPLSSK